MTYAYRRIIGVMIVHNLFSVIESQNGTECDTFDVEVSSHRSISTKSTVTNVPGTVYGYDIRN